MNIVNLEKLRPIAERLKTQDNRMTCNPMFCVQVKERIGPFILDYCDDKMYHDHEETETYYPESEQWKKFNALDEEGKLPDHVSVGGFRENWKTVAVCFTEQGCKDHLEQNGHNYRHYHGEPRIYVDSFFRNPEMQEIMDFLMNYNTVGGAGLVGVDRASASVPTLDDLANRIAADILTVSASGKPVQCSRAVMMKGKYPDGERDMGGRNAASIAFIVKEHLKGGDGSNSEQRFIGRDELIGGIGVLREAVEKLLEVNHLKETPDAELECHAHRGWSPEMQDECENVLLARNALRITGYLPG